MKMDQPVVPAATVETGVPSNRTYVYGIAATAAISGLLFGYDTAVINGALVFLREQFRYDSHLIQRN